MAELPWQRACDALVEELGRHRIRDPRVLSAFRRVPRHRFCEPADQAHAYRDDVLPLPCGATLSQPLVVAAMLQALQLEGGERVLDVGSGSGYTTALLCELAGTVYALERERPLVERAAALLRELGYENFAMKEGDGWDGWLEHMPFDAVLVSAAVPGVPPALLDQLAAGGRLVAPVGGEASQMLRVVGPRPDGSGRLMRDIFEVRFVPLRRGAD